MTKKTEDFGGRILALVSHKLRTPLSIINGYSEAVMAQKTEENFSPFTDKALDEIHKQGQHMADLVYKLLQFSKLIELENKPLEKTSLNLRETLIDAVKKAITFVTENRNLKTAVKGDTITHGPFRVEISCPAKIAVMAEQTLISTALTELVENALKFNNKPEKVVKITCMENVSNISISVKDEGPGLRPGEINKIFDKFYQVEDVFTGQVGGWGLGLPFVKTTAEMHGGMVSVVSDMGLGSVFSITIPN